MSAADHHLRRWVSEGMTGCQFATLIAQQRERIVTTTFTGFAPEVDVTRLFDFGAGAHVPVIAIFTGIRTERDLVEQLRILSAGERWKITEEHPDGLVTDEVLIGIEWAIRPGLTSLPMGLAPFATMPVTRRAPYVCIAAWPGEHENPHWTHYDERIVHLLDTELSKLQLTTPKYRSLTTASQDATHELLSQLGDDARHYRRVAFRIQSSAREALHGAFAASRS
jgi:hypothetical protein